MAASQLGLEGKGLRYKLLVIEALVFVLPFLVLFYLFYQNKTLFHTDQLLMLALILVLILAGLILLRGIFDKVFAVSRMFKNMVSDDQKPVGKEKDIDELRQITLSFSRIMNDLEVSNKQLRQRVFELLSIRELIEVARKSLDIEALLELLLKKAVSVSGAQTASILMVDSDKQHFRVAASQGRKPGPEKSATIDIKESILRFIMDHRAPLLVQDIETDQRIQKPNNPKYDTPSFISIPLFVKDDIVAVLNLSDKETQEVFDENDRNILSIMIDEVAFALENAQLHTEVASQLSSIQIKTEELTRMNAQMEQEIAERLAAENALRKSEARYRLLIENANDSIYILQNGGVQFLNPKTEALTGYSQEELSGLPFETLIHAEDREWVMKRHDRYMREQEAPSPYTFRIVSKDKGVRWVQQNTVSIVWNGETAGLNFLRDITEQKKLENQFYHAQKMESIGTLAGGVAHEFNNLLMAILGNANIMLLDLEPNDPHVDRLKRIEASVKRGAFLTRQLLGFARGGKYEIKILDVNQLIRLTADMFGQTRKEIKIELSLQSDLWAIEADPNQLEQMLMNLYVNAWEAMPDGGDLVIASENVDVTERHGKAEPGSYVKVTVTDTGIGMDEDVRQRIFDPFFTTRVHEQGAGLGLAAVYGIIKNHGGFVDVISEPKKHTTFQIYLPATKKDPLPEPVASEDVPEVKVTLLLVDDEEIILEVTRQMLETLGHRVLVAKSGTEAVERYSAHQDSVDAVILDMIMPGMSGSETFDRLKEINPDIRVLLSSGYSIDGRAKEILGRGCKGFIQKPFTIKGLSLKIREILAESP